MLDAACQIVDVCDTVGIWRRRINLACTTAAGENYSFVIKTMAGKNENSVEF